jgi:hypothetical protein
VYRKIRALGEEVWTGVEYWKCFYLPSLLNFSAYKYTIISDNMFYFFSVAVSM